MRCISKEQNLNSSAEHSLVLRSPYCLDYGFYTNRSLFLQSIDIYIYVAERVIYLEC